MPLPAHQCTAPVLNQKKLASVQGVRQDLSVMFTSTDTGATGSPNPRDLHSVRENQPHLYSQKWKDL